MTEMPLLYVDFFGVLIVAMVEVLAKAQCGEYLPKVLPNFDKHT